ESDSRAWRDRHSATGSRGARPPPAGRARYPGLSALQARCVALQSYSPPPARDSVKLIANAHLAKSFCRALSDPAKFQILKGRSPFIKALGPIDEHAAPGHNNFDVLWQTPS